MATSKVVVDVTADPEDTKKEIGSGIFGAKNLQVLFWFSLMCVASLVMTVGNKAIMKEWSYPNTVLIIQQVISAGILATGAATKRWEVNRLTLEQFKVFSIPSFILCIQIYTSLQALPYVAVATVVVFRNCGTVLVAFGDRILFGTQLSRHGWYSIAMIVVGSQIYAGTDINYDPIGYRWLLINTVAGVANTFYNKHFISGSDQTSAGISLIQAITTIPILLVLAFSLGELSASAQGPKPEGWVQILILATSFGGSVLSTCYATVYRLVSSTTVTVAANFNKIVSIIAACVVFHTILVATQWFGLVLAMTGSVLYSLKR